MPDAANNLLCVRCLRPLGVQQGRLVDACPSCRTDTGESRSRWKRFAERDGALVGGALLVILICKAFEALINLAIQVVSLWIDPSLAHVGASQQMPDIAKFPVAVWILMGLGFVSVLPALAGYVAWIMILIVSIRGALSRVVLPIAASAGAMILLMAGSMGTALVLGAVARGDAERMITTMRLQSAIVGLASLLVMSVGLTWAIDQMQRSLTTDRTRLALLWLLALASVAGAMPGLIRAQFATEPTVMSPVAVLLVVIGALISLAFAAAVIERLWALRREALRMVRVAAPLIDAGVPMRTSDLVPPVISRGR